MSKNFEYILNIIDENDERYIDFIFNGERLIIKKRTLFATFSFDNIKRLHNFLNCVLKEYDTSTTETE